MFKFWGLELFSTKMDQTCCGSMRYDYFCARSCWMPRSSVFIRIDGSDTSHQISLREKRHLASTEKVKFVCSPRYPNACRFSATPGSLRPPAYPLPSTWSSINPSASPNLSFFDGFPSLSFFAFLNGVSHTKQTPDSLSKAMQVAQVTCPQIGATAVSHKRMGLHGMTWNYCLMPFYKKDIFVRAAPPLF